jgi:hypothetical protein
MKTKIGMTLAFLGLMGVVLKAQTLEESLNASLPKFEAATTDQQMIATASGLDMIASKWGDQWISSFYSAYAKIKISLKLTEKTKRDQYLDAANLLLDKADKLSPNNEEILILQAWSAKARIAIDGKDRWKKYGEVYDDLIAKAKKINPENPRIYFLEGQGPFYKPKMWGGGKDKAKPYFEKAKVLFDKENKQAILIPSWGAKEDEDLLKQCNE